jgi:hypothetical protein
MGIGIKILIGVAAFNGVVITAMLIYWWWALRHDAQQVRAAMPGLHDEIETELAKHAPADAGDRRLDAPQQLLPPESSHAAPISGRSPRRN